MYISINVELALSKVETGFFGKVFGSGVIGVLQ
jgi:hypothetical protein